MERNGDYVETWCHRVPYVFNKLRVKPYLMFSLDSPSHAYTHTHVLFNIYCLLFHCNICYLNMPQYYVIPTLPVMLARFLNTAWPLKRSQGTVLTVKTKDAIFSLRELKTESRRSRYGVVSTVTRPRPGPSLVQFLVETKRRLLPPKRPIRVWSRSSILFNGYRNYFPWVKRSKGDVDHSPPSRAEV
jgi:hypothetical protein